MCGIAGAVWNDANKAVEQATLQRMTDVLCHRGPDGEGTYLADPQGPTGVALGHRRLAIIDVAGGKQPLSNEDGSVWVVFNGEIYNFRAPAPPTGRRRPSLPHPKRHGSARPPLRRRRARDAGATQRHVRPGPVGCQAAAIAAGPRSVGKKAAGVSSRAGPAAVRQRVEGPAASAGRAPGDRPAGPR